MAFSEGATVVDSNGDITETNGTSEKNTAGSHSKGTYTKANHLEIWALTMLIDAPPAKDPAVDEVTELLKGLNKKKKSSKKPKEEAVDGADEPAPAAEGEFDPSALKKKKKKKLSKPVEDDFEAKLAEAGVNENGEAIDDSSATAAPQEEAGGDMLLGTGIWSHGEVVSQHVF